MNLVSDLTGVVPVDRAVVELLVPLGALVSNSRGCALYVALRKATEVITSLTPRHGDDPHDFSRMPEVGLIDHET